MEIVVHPASKIHVLLVDDDDDIREFLVYSLKEMDIFASVVQAKDGSDAFYKFNNQNFDLIITDLLMPKTNGLELVTNIYNSSKKKPSMMILSGNLTSTEVKEAMKLGVKNFIVKPCTEEQFREKVANLVCKELAHKLVPAKSS